MSRSLRMALSETEHLGIRLAGPVPIRDLVVVIRDVQIDQRKVERPLSGYLRIVDAELLARAQSVVVQRSSPIAFGRPNGCSRQCQQLWAWTEPVERDQAEVL